jgi:preprotein translocase subunit SecG
MLSTIFNVIYVLVAIAMIALILLQRGAGAQAGSGFGSGASSTVFGARGAATFLTRSTAVLAALFFVLSLGMGIYLGRAGVSKPTDDLGLVGGGEVSTATVPETPSTGGSEVPSVPADKSAAPVEPPKPAPTAPAEKKDASAGKKPDEAKKNK